MKNLNPQHGGTFLGVALGLLIGVLISLGVVFYLNRTPLPFIEKVIKQEPRENGNGGKPVALPGKPGDKPIDKSAEKVTDKPADKPAEKKFEFYDILEGKKSSPSVSEAKPEKKGSETAATPAGGFHLQVGAFQKRADADNLRAKLAMLGFETTIQETEVPDKGTMFRVRVGPYGSPEEMNRARTQLSQQGVPAAVVRPKD